MSAGDAPQHLAQLNVGRLVAPLDSPAIADFVAGLAAINALADASPGFVWRLQTDAGDATSIDVFGDELEIINLSVWESLESLSRFVFDTDHVGYLRRRREWFERPSEAISVLWWVPAGSIPSIPEALDRLEHLRRHGPSASAFTFQTAFDPPGDAATRPPRRRSRP